MKPEEGGTKIMITGDWEKGDGGGGGWHAHCEVPVQFPVGTLREVTRQG